MAQPFDSQLPSLFLAEFGFLSYDFAVHFRIPTSNHGPTVFVVVVVFEEASWGNQSRKTFIARHSKTSRYGR